MRRGKFVPLVGCFVLALTTATQAQVTLLGNYRLGEDDAGAVVGGAGNATTTDHLGCHHFDVCHHSRKWESHLFRG